MCRGKELSPQLRSRICELKKVGFKPTRIHKMYPEVPLSTIKTTIRAEARRENNVSRPRTGAPRKLTDEDRDRIRDLVSQNPHITNRALLDAMDNKIKIKTLQNLLKEMGARRWLQKRGPDADRLSSGNQGP